MAELKILVDAIQSSKFISEIRQKILSKNWRNQSAYMMLSYLIERLR